MQLKSLNADISISRAPDINNNNNMSLFISRFIYCNSTSKRQTSIIFGPDPKEPCGQSELLRLTHWQELNPTPADLEAGMLTPRPN